MSAFRPKRLSIATISAEPMSIELSEPFGIATGSQLCAANVLVRLGLSDGSCGLGEAAPFPAVSGETQQGTLTALERVKHEFLGEPAERWRLVCQKMQELLPDQPSAACALECALLDAWLRSLGCSMWCFFGGSERSLVSDLTLPTGSVDAAARAARRALSLGFRLLKVKVGGQALDLDAERLRVIARSVPEARLVLDANGALSAEQALDLLRESGPARQRIELFEQPTAREDLDGLRRVMLEGNIEVAADESAKSCDDVVHLCEKRAASAINIKIMKSGVSQALDMITLAKRHGLKLMVGGMVESRLAMSVSACIAAGVGGFSWVDLDTPLFMVNAPLSGGFVRAGDCLHVDVIETGHGVGWLAAAC